MFRLGDILGGIHRLCHGGIIKNCRGGIHRHRRGDTLGLRLGGILGLTSSLVDLVKSIASEQR